MLFVFIVFWFKQKTAYDMRISDWSSDVCSSDLVLWRAHACVVIAGKHDQSGIRMCQLCCAQAPCHQRIAVAIGAVERGVVVSDDIDRQASLAQCPHPIKQCEHRPAEIGRAPSELQSLMRISYAVFCLKKKNKLYLH